MPVIYLAVNSTWAASGVTDQGSLDSTTGAPLGPIVIPCPGVFPCRISCKSRVGNGTTAAVVAQVYAGASHVVIQEYLHDYLPAVGNRLRIESIQLGTKVAGGLYIQPLQTTANPSPDPYANTLGPLQAKLPSISLNGLPANLFKYLTAPVGQVVGDCYSNVGQFDTIFDRHYLDDGVNLLWSSQTTGAAPISISLGSVIVANGGQYLTANVGSLVPRQPIKFLIAPRPPAGLGIIDADAIVGAGYYPGGRRSVHTFPVTEGAPTFACFGGAALTFGGVPHLPTVYGTSSSNYIKSLAVHPVSSMALGMHMYSFAGINAATDQVFMGSFPIADTTIPAADMYFQSLEMYRTGDDSAALKPALAFTTEYSSVSTNNGTFNNNYWSSSYPLGTRFNKYSDVKTNQYGYVFLNKNTKHLEFLFAPYMDPWSTEASTQVIHKLVHAPPRSADYIPALNMQFGVDPRSPLTGPSIYRANDADVRRFYDDDHHIHGGGGHVMALGTYNGAIVNQGTVAVWGSNRWGQCVVPAVLNGLTLVDVAVANAPPVLLTTFGGTEYISPAKFSVYSDDVAEKAARDYNSPDPLDATTGANPFVYSYPPSTAERYGRHINYTNLPGHVVVVTSSGWVYAWGNNKYYQCAVPEEISLVDINGLLKTGVPADPISEVAAGAFHTVARSKAGVLYVWGAGAPYVATLPGGTADGYITTAVASDSIPTSTTPNTNVSRSVHFGQSCLFSTTAGANSTKISASGLAIPSRVPQGLVDSTTITEVYQFNDIPASGIIGFTLYPATSITLLTKGGVNVGQKTLAGFCPTDPVGGRLKGMIAAGAFHTAVIDIELKIQCFGAGRGPVAATAVGITVDVTNPAVPRSLTSAPQWGSSYSATGHLFSTYPHYCQSIGQYRAPYHNTAYNDETTAANLFRHPNTISGNSCLKFFQDLQFKKVTCGPFTTHGIVHSVSRLPFSTEGFTAVDKTHLAGRVVSWGCTHGPRSKFLLGTGPTGILGQTGGIINQFPQSVIYSECGYSRTDNFGVVTPPNTRSLLNQNLNTVYSAAGTLCGAGAVDTESVHTIGATTFSTPRMFEVLNRVVNTGPTSPNYLNLVSDPGPASGNTASGTISAGVGAGTAHACACPVTISRFKVKDVASCGDYTMFIGYVNNLSQSSTKQWPGDSEATSPGQYGSFDYEASVFFTGEDNYCVIATEGMSNVRTPRPNISNETDSTSSIYGRHYANNPYAGTNLTRRNKIGLEPDLETYHYALNTAIPLKTRSLHFGLIKQTSAGVAGALLGDATAFRTVKYVIPTTALASANMVAAVVNMDNRPVAWTGAFQQGITHTAPLDLSLLPSVPISSFKLGKGHIMAVTAGDWPVAVGLSTFAGTPRLVSELGNRLFDTTVANTTLTTGVAATLIYGEAGVYTRPVLLAWGAGDGREQGTSLLAFPRDRFSRSTYGMGFLDTHAIARHDISSGTTLPLAVTTDAWENYYGHYRWNVHSSLSPNYLTFEALGPSQDGGTTGGELAGQVIKLPAGHHAIEAMQSILSFRPDKYPTTFAAVALAGRGLLNGSNLAAIPAAAYRPFVDYSTLKTGTDLKRTVCCATAADEAQSNYASINSLQEYHSPLGYYQQSYTDYAVDYAAGSMHSAVLFKSACLSYPNIAAGSHLTNLSNFTSMFMADAVGAVPFGNRRVCKLGIVGYGCENQTAGRERKLSDGMAPLVPMLFGTNAKVYCGDSYTLVTEPIKVLTLTSATVAVALGTPAVGSGFTEQIIPITVSPTLFSRRIRGLDVVLTFTATSAATAIPLHNLNLKVKYKSNTWMVLGKVRANLDTTPANAFVPNGTATTVYRFSDRFNPTNSYKYADYDEVGLNPSTSGSYTLATNYFLKGAATAPAIPALSKQGCYYPVTVVADVATAESWSMVGTTGGVVLPFNESTINVVIEDYTSATAYAGYTLEVKLEVEVDAADLPYVLFGPTRSGVFNEIAGLGPSIQADISSFNPDTTLPIRSCPCEQDLVMDHRKAPKSFLPDSSFVCGTKKYGPSGNRDNYAAYALEGFVDLTFNYNRSPLLSGARVTANFFHVFDTIPHRSLLRMSEQLYATGPVLHALPAAAFVSTGTIILLGSADVKVVNLKAVAAAVRLVGDNGKAAARLSTNAPVLYNKTLFSSSTAFKLQTLTTIKLNLNVALSSGICP